MQNKNVKADLILYGNNIFTGVNEHLISGAVVIKDNKIIKVCSRKESKDYINPSTKEFEYNDELIMPGFHDLHSHIFLGGLFEHSVLLSETRSEEEAAEMVKEFANCHQELPWILGFQWHYMDWDRKELPTRHSLDRLIPDRPVMLMNSALHSAWLNSKALQVLGIDKDTPDPPFGYIKKDNEGNLTGLLLESAVSLAVEEAFKLPLELEKKILADFFRKSSELGITSATDMLPLPGFELGNLDLYKELEEQGELTTRINFVTTLNGDLNHARIYHNKFNSDKLRFSGLKQFLDGVPSLYTAYLLEPYTNNPQTKGNAFISESTLEKWVAEADKEGFRVRLHACGDAAVRLALDVYEHAEEVNGKRDARHTIEHVELIHPNDINRFSKLNVVASMQPEHLSFTGSFVNNTFDSYFGKERTRYAFPVNSLKDAEAPIAFGSDYPVVELDPLLEVYRAVTRVCNDGEPACGWIPSEKITLAEALKFYTQGSAYGNFVENLLGTIEEGKLADIIVLDRNLFSIPIEDIPQAKVRLTITDGEVVYDSLVKQDK